MFDINDDRVVADKNKNRNGVCGGGGGRVQHEYFAHEGIC